MCCNIISSFILVYFQLHILAFYISTEKSYVLGLIYKLSSFCSAKLYSISQLRQKLQILQRSTIYTAHTAFQVVPGSKKGLLPIQWFFCNSFGVLSPKGLIFKSSGSNAVKRKSNLELQKKKVKKTKSEELAILRRYTPS